MNKTDNILNRILRLFVLSGLMALTVACDMDGEPLPVDPKEQDVETVTVPVIIRLGFEAETDASARTRSVPPGAGGGITGTVFDNGYAETGEIAHVRLITFRRKDPDNAHVGAPVDNFVYDAQNDKILSVEAGNLVVGGDDMNPDAGHYHRVARGTIKKTYGYEYRVVAIAYNGAHGTGQVFPEVSGSGINSWMALNVGDGLRFEDLQAKFASVETEEDGVWEDYLGGDVSNNTKSLTSQVTSVPQLFYGQCYAEGTDNPIIDYALTDAEGNETTDIPLHGVCYRGMAKVEVRVKMNPYDDTGDDDPPAWVCLLASNVLTRVNLSDYDNFNIGSEPVPSGGDGGEFTAVAYTATFNAQEGYTVLSAWLLPGKVKLALRAKFTRSGFADFTDEFVNGQIHTADVSFAENATGVISPDAHDNVFYLRRNHKYVFTCSGSEIIFNHEID